LEVPLENGNDEKPLDVTVHFLQEYMLLYGSDKRSFIYILLLRIFLQMNFKEELDVPQSISHRRLNEIQRITIAEQFEVDLVVRKL